QIFGPSRHFAKLPDSLCRYFNVRIYFNWHVSRQATESYVKRSAALGLISHEGSPYPDYRLREAAYNLSTLLAIGQRRVPIQSDAIRHPLLHPKATIRRTWVSSHLCNRRRWSTGSLRS